MSAVPPVSPVSQVPPVPPTSAIRAMLTALVNASARHPRGAPVAPRPGGSFADYALLKREIKARGLLDRQPVFYTYKIVSILAFQLAGAGWVVFTRGTPWVWAGAWLLAFASCQTLLLGHNAAHRAVFASARGNLALGLVAINLFTGGSQGWWTRSHNDHHARSNDPDLDADITYPFFAFSDEQAAAIDPCFHPIVRRQHVLAFLLTGLSSVNVRVYSLVDMLRKGRRGELLASLTFYAAYTAFVLGQLGVVRGLVFALVHQILFGFYIGSITTVNHWAMPMLRGSHQMDFVRHQVSTARNVAGRGLADLWYGGLNLQIEHHLFPTMPRNNLRKARPLVQRFCADRGIPYHEVGPYAAYRELFITLRAVARRCP